MSDMPMQEEHRTVTAAESTDLFLIVKLPLIYNDDSFDPSRGVRLLPGKYVLEAEDAECWYFRSPKPLSLLIYDFGNIVNAVSIHGGIMVSKDESSHKLPSAYVDGNNDTERITVWELGKDFVTDRGQKWHLSTDGDETPENR